MRGLIWIAALFVTGCSAEFWDMTPSTQIAIEPGTAATLRIDRVEVRSSYYDPPDAFSRAFVPALKARTDVCLSGPAGATAVVFVHALDRGSDLSDGRLSASVEVKDARGRVLARFPVAVDLPTAGDVEARRRAAGDLFGQSICTELGAR
ncbi:MAG TPA: hypothetical protein VGR32_11475 [Brevundimonas sp.]|jgi:hypothetical protein|uniref:hypothetical protein n=1 Tax=Brevundimonas sp. TaxID=1871086 RepID=UPI002DE63E47|nr:hypothetical protein [Brevundimonas sp.]